MSLFQALYGRQPPYIPPYTPRTLKVQAVNEMLSRKRCLRELKEKLLATQNRMKTKADEGRHELQFEEGDLVLVNLRP